MSVHLLLMLFSTLLIDCQIFDNQNQNTKILVQNSKNAFFIWNFSLPANKTLKQMTFGYKNPNDEKEVTIGFFSLGLDEPILNRGVLKTQRFKSIEIKTNGTARATLKLPSVLETEDDGLSFFCEIQTENLLIERSTITLEVINPPVINYKSLSRMLVEAGSRVLLLCGTSGKPDATVMWLRGSQKISNGTKQVDQLFKHVRKIDEGNYTCVASNIAGSANYTVELVVQYKPVINKTLSTMRVGSYLGNELVSRLLCIADGFPPPVFTWNGPQGHERGAKSTFALERPGEEDFGKYVCTASNDLGHDSQTISLYQITRPARVSAFINDIKSTTAELQFTTPTKLGDGTLKELTLSYRNLDKAGSLPTTKELDPSIETYFVRDLIAYTNYEMNVTVKNEFFESPGQNILFRTKESVPGKPSNVTATAISSSHVRVTWSPPARPNGEILGYELKFFRQKAVQFDNATVVDMQMKLSKDFNQLEAYTEYTAYVRAETRIGFGEWSKGTLTRTESKPPSVPRGLSVDVINYKSVRISWSAPLEVNHAPATMYGILIKQSSLENVDRPPTVVLLEYVLEDTPNNRDYLIRTMMPFSRCEISVREATSEKIRWGNYTQEKVVTLPEGVPKEPRDVKILEVKSDFIRLKWQRPSQINGILTKFTITYSNSSGSYSNELAKQLTNKTFYFTVGYLRANTEYNVYVQAHSNAYPSTKPAPLTVTSSKSDETAVGPRKDTGGGSNTGAILGGVISAVLLLVVLLLLARYIKRRKRKTMKSTNSESSNAGFMKLANRDSSPVHEVEAPAMPSANGFISSDYARSLQCTFTPLRPVLVSALKDYVAKCHGNREKGFIDEFRSIKPEGDFTYEVSTRPDNKCKNRYANILAYDHSRVVLNTVENLDGSDYVNANYIDGYARKAKFVATQGPVLAAFKDFWRMVWEQNTQTIVMVTNLVERSRIKCQKYWPTISEKSQEHDNIRVDILDEMELADYIIRRFKIYQMRNGEAQASREVTQYQFLSWPDHGVPQFATPLLQFIRRVRSVSDADPGPIVLHCSAGVGRTGTYITIDCMLDQIALEKTVDVFGYVTHIRTQRILMVQTEAQYVFIYNSLLEAVSCGDTEVSAGDLQSRIKHLDTLNPSSARTYMQEEYERLEMNFDDSTQYEAAILPVNEGKNRFKDILPYESTRVKLWPYPSVEGSDYINASFLDGYQQREAYILTQAPLESTIQEYWRMIWEYEVFSTVMISSAQERDMHHCFPYWPTNDDEQCSAMFGLLRVQIVGVDERTGYCKREFKVTNSKNGESRVLSHFMFHDWPIDNNPSHVAILEMIGQLQKVQQNTGNSSIVMHCSDGSGRSGSLAALMYCLERLKLENVVDVFQTVRSMRTQRKALVQTMEQYQFIYLAVRNFLECYSNYSNFK